jgi:hypothetical protein
LQLNVHFTDPRIELEVKFNVYRDFQPEGETTWRIKETLAADDRVAVANNFLHTAFSAMSFSINNVPVSEMHSGAWPIVCYLKELLSTSLSYKDEASRANAASARCTFISYRAL